MSDGNDTMDKAIEAWLNCCSEITREGAQPLYLDDDRPALEDAVPVDVTNSSMEQIRQFAKVMKDRLAVNPNDFNIRFAALYPFRSIVLRNPHDESLAPYFQYSRGSEVLDTFKSFARAVSPQALLNLSDIKFELYNAYLVANWERAEELFRRIAVLNLEPAPALSALRGQFWFFSVFGRQIQFELD